MTPRTVASAATKVTSASTRLNAAATQAASSAKTLTSALTAISTATKALETAVTSLNDATKALAAAPARPAPVKAATVRPSTTRPTDNAVYRAKWHDDWRCGQDRGGEDRDQGGASAGGRLDGRPRESRQAAGRPRPAPATPASRSGARTTATGAGGGRTAATVRPADTARAGTVKADDDKPKKAGQGLAAGQAEGQDGKVKVEVGQAEGRRQARACDGSRRRAPRPTRTAPRRPPRSPRAASPTTCSPGSSGKPCVLDGIRTLDR